MNKYLLRISVTTLIIFLCTSISDSADIKILVIPKGSKATFWNKVHDGALTASKDLGIKITYRGPHTEDQYTAQYKTIEYGIRKKVDAIVLAPNHVNMVGPALKKALENGIKIVLIDSNMDTQYHVSIVESDNYKSGQMAADYMASQINESGNVILARHIKNHASTDERERGFLDTVTSRYPGVNVIADPYVGSSVGLAYHTISDFLDHSESIDSIVAVGEEATIGILRALKKKDFQRKIRLIGFDFNPSIRDAILSHEMDATIVQNPFQIGYLGVKTAYQAALGEIVPTKINTDTMLINAMNYQTTEVQAIIRSNINHQD